MHNGYVLALTELQHRREAEAGVKQIATEIEGLIDAYWNAAYAEGEQHRTTDTPDGRAQKIRSGITSRLARLAASPSSPASGVRVKALEFDEDVGWPRIARTPFGDYKIWAGKDVWFNHIWLRDMHAPSYETAKQWAQEDYEQRVLSALGEHP
jgi:hypothetical protein